MLLFFASLLPALVSTKNPDGFFETTSTFPAMSPAEQRALVSFLCQHPGHGLLEFGSGGSTIAAAYCELRVVHSFDSSEAWLQKLRNDPVWSTTRTEWFAYHVDIGPVRDWGYPDLPSHPGFSLYNQADELVAPSDVSIVFVDGRFRVACALRALRFMRRDSVLVVHDFDRSEYGVIGEFYEETRRVGTLAFFKRKKFIGVNRWFEVLEGHKMIPGKK